MKKGFERLGWVNIGAIVKAFLNARKALSVSSLHSNLFLQISRVRGKVI